MVASDYALFMAVKDQFGGVEWTKWGGGYPSPLGKCHGLLPQRMYFDMNSSSICSLNL